ncbi:AAA family ATPase [Candidatus Palauibacter sp.]|uniref:AAA family ATPase n=1 Tax=Candidatus Palauibacter sp. TaxID=3101350 RepID=UPI003B02CB7C
MHHFNDFKSFHDARINLLRPLTILIGPNGSGKTNALEAIEVLSTIASGHRLQEIADLGREAALNVRGGLQACVRHGEDTFTLSFRARVRWLRNHHRVAYSVSIRPRPEPRIVHESLKLTDDDTLLFETLGAGSPHSADIRVRYNNFARGGQKPQSSVSATRSALSQYERFAIRNQRLSDCLQLISGLRDHLAASFVFDPKPYAMRRYERIGHELLLRDGSNLSSVLCSLHSNGPAATETLRSLFEHVRHVPEEMYSQFEFVKTELGDVMLGLREQDSGMLTDARLLSDGTLRTLAVLTAVATSHKLSRVVVEEFDNGLHPSRISALVATLAEMGEQRKVNVVLSTHNPVTLDSLTENQLQGVVLAFRSRNDGSTKLQRLVDLPRHDELLERGSLGGLVTRRIIDQYVRDEASEERAAKMRRWLEERT